MRDAVLLTTHGFDARYEVQQVPRSSAIAIAHEIRRFPSTQTGISVQTVRQGLVLEVTPFGMESWIGNFQSGPEGLDGIFATPHAAIVCVVVKGQGYWIPVLDPTAFELVRSIPIKQVLPIADRRGLLFVDHTRIAAFGEGCFLWRTEDLSWDGLEITDISAKVVLGTAWDSPAERRVSFSVDLDTGQSEGGSSPARYGAVRSRR